MPEENLKAISTEPKSFEYNEAKEEKTIKLKDGKVSEACQECIQALYCCTLCATCMNSWMTCFDRCC